MFDHHSRESQCTIYIIFRPYSALIAIIFSLRVFAAMKVLGQDVGVMVNQLHALVANVISWIFALFWKVPDVLSPMENSCVVITGPGGAEKLQFRKLPDAKVGATVGYNIPMFKSPFVSCEDVDELPDDSVVVKTSHFSVNYADVCIRWGLYESALRYVGWPIVPGFDFCGVIEHSCPNSSYKVGDKVFGYTMFGAYSSKIVVPARQIRAIPENIAPQSMAGVPAVAATALHCLHLAGAWKKGGGQMLLARSKACLIHSAGGGVGSMLIQMCKLQGFSPVVAVVGSSHKVAYCVELGADYVIDKSKGTGTVALWQEAERISSSGYAAIFDANGVETLGDSYAHLSQNGKLVVYGFHTNLPQGADLLSPAAWVKMAWKLAAMPKFDPMEMVLSSRSVCGFNLSFFADEHELIEAYMQQIVSWVASGKVTPSRVTCYDVTEIRKAHALIQTGKSMGKIVLKYD